MKLYNAARQPYVYPAKKKEILAKTFQKRSLEVVSEDQYEEAPLFVYTPSPGSISVSQFFKSQIT